MMAKQVRLLSGTHHFLFHFSDDLCGAYWHTGPFLATSEADGICFVPVPTPLPGLGGVRIVSVSCGSRHTLALDAQVRVTMICWRWHS